DEDRGCGHTHARPRRSVHRRECRLSAALGGRDRDPPAAIPGGAVIEAVAAVMLVSLIAYCVLAGADFGGGVWDLLATGPRAERQKQPVDDAIAPVWEANHVWLVLIVVLLFSCFPAAFAAAGIALHIPLTLMLIGIVLR